MNVEAQYIFAVANILLGIVLALVGWSVGRLTKQVDTLDQDVRLLPEKYVAKADYRADITDIKQLLERISDKLDGKADKA